MPRPFDVPVEAPDETTEFGRRGVVGDCGERRAEDAPVGAAVAQGDAVAGARRPGSGG